MIDFKIVRRISLWAPVCILVPASILPFIVDNQVHAHIPVEFIVSLISLVAVCGISLLSLIVNFKNYKEMKFGSVLIKINVLLFVVSLVLFLFYK